MGKKKTTKKAVKKTSAKRSTKAAAKKKSSVKTSGKKTTKAKTKATASRSKTAKKATAKKKVAKKTTAKKKVAKKAPAKKAVKKAAKKAVKKATRKTAGKAAIKKTAKRPAVKPAVACAAASEQQPSPPPRAKRLKAKELREFKTLLLQKRAELVGDVAQLTSEALKGSDAGGPEHSAMPIHMADVGSDNWEQEFNLIQIDHERDIVREIDEALERIENKTYGTCLATNRPISLARLRAKPWAKYCIDYRRALEEGKAH